MDKENYGLLDWIDINSLSWSGLSRNPNAIHLLEEYPERINWKTLSGTGQDGLLNLSVP